MTTICRLPKAPAHAEPSLSPEASPSEPSHGATEVSFEVREIYSADGPGLYPPVGVDLFGSFVVGIPSPNPRAGDAMQQAALQGNVEAMRKAFERGGRWQHVEPIVRRQVAEAGHVGALITLLGWGMPLTHMLHRGAQPNASTALVASFFPTFSPLRRAELLHEAAMVGDWGVMEHLMRVYHLSPDRKNGLSESALAAATRVGNVTVLRRLLESRHYVNPGSLKGLLKPDFPVVTAVSHGQVECLDAMVDHGAQPGGYYTAVSYDGASHSVSMLCVAVIAGHLPMVEFLLRRRCNPDRGAEQAPVGGQRIVPLNLALEQRRSPVMLRIAATLVAAGADPRNLGLSDPNAKSLAEALTSLVAAHLGHAFKVIDAAGLARRERAVKVARAQWVDSLLTQARAHEPATRTVSTATQT